MLYSIGPHLRCHKCGPNHSMPRDWGHMSLKTARPSYAGGEMSYSRGRVIYRRMQELGKSSSTCARELGVSTSRWHSIIAGRYDPALSTAIRICSVLQLPLTELAYPSIVTVAEGGDGQ